MTTDTRAEPAPRARSDPSSEEDTRQNPLPNPLGWLPAVFILLILIAGGALALLQPETWHWPREGSFWRGQQVAAYEESFNEALPFRDAAIATWGVLEYTLFHEGREGVVVGTDGWLFTSEEVAFYPSAASETARKLAFIERVQADLQRRNIALVVALVPDKSRVYADKVGRELPSYTQDRYEGFRAKLLDAGILAPDLLSVFMSAKVETPLYLRTDTHWTPAGAELAAQALAEALENADVPGLFATDYTTTGTGTETYEGDLLSFLPLGILQNRLGPAPDRLEQRETGGGSSSGSGLFGAQTIPITLIGTSYSANKRWNFTGALQDAFGADVLNLATEGRGPLPPMRDYLESPELRDTPPSLVVWEIPERYLPITEETRE